MKSDIIDIPCDKVTETEKALLLKFDENVEVWFPKSQVEYGGQMVSLPEKLAIDKGVENYR